MEGMTDEGHRTRAIRAVLATMEASARLRANLLEGEKIGQAMIDLLEADTPVSETVGATGREASDLRSTTNELLSAFEHRRHQMRLAFITPSLEEGLSIGEISRVLGISRQLASRLAREAAEAHQAQEA